MGRPAQLQPAARCPVKVNKTFAVCRPRENYLQGGGGKEGFENIVEQNLLRSVRSENIMNPARHLQLLDTAAVAQHGVGSHVSGDTRHHGRTGGSDT